MKKKSHRKKKKVNGIKLFVILILILVVVVLIIEKQKNKDLSGDMKGLGDSKNTQNTTNDNTSPEIILEYEEIILAIGADYKPLATATDDVDGDLSSEIQYSEIDTSTAGKYEVELSVSDKAGNTTNKTQKVIVREELSNGLPVLMYHFFYDNDKYEKQDNNWLKIEDFEEQLKYMTENDYYFPTWDEVNDYIDSKITLPSKSVVITVDDGDASFFDLAVPLIQKYKVPATTFVITSWYGKRYDPTMEYVSWQSHSDQMHESGANGKGRMVNWTYDQILNDLKTSSEILEGANIFCYPFGHYNDTAIKALKDSPFIMAFTIEGGRVNKGANKYKLPRVRVTDGNSLDYFAKSIS